VSLDSAIFDGIRVLAICGALANAVAATLLNRSSTGKILSALWLLLVFWRCYFKPGTPRSGVDLIDLFMLVYSAFLLARTIRGSKAPAPHRFDSAIESEGDGGASKSEK